MILLINKDNLFNEKYLSNIELNEYENYNENMILLENETLRHFEMLKAHLKIDNIIIDIKNGYRSLESQENIFLEKIKKYGIDKAEQLEDMPGTSDYHTATSIYLILYKDNKWLTKEEELIKEEKIFKKIHSILHYFGFIVRFPKNKEHITGHPYEPWHIRYVGEELASIIKDITIEEYLNQQDK